MKIEVGSCAVNQLLSGDPNLFTMPASAPQKVDLTTLSGSKSDKMSPQHFSSQRNIALGLGNLQPLRTAILES